MVGGVGNGAAEEDWRWDLNPGMAARRVRTKQLWLEERTMWLWGSLCHMA